MKLALVVKKSFNVLFADLLKYRLKEYYEVFLYEINENDFIDSSAISNSLDAVILFRESLKISDLLQIDNSFDESIPFVFISSSAITHGDISNIVNATKKRKLAWLSSNNKFENLKMEIDNFHTSHSQLFLSDEIQKTILENVIYNRLITIEETPTEFTKLEEDIINASIKGESIKDMAQNLKLSPNTIAVYRSKLLKKTKFKSMNQLVQYYMKQRRYNSY